MPIKLNSNIVANEGGVIGKAFQGLIKILKYPIRGIWIKNITGQENLPQCGPYIVAANHQSNFDAVSLIAAIRDRMFFLTGEKFYRSIFWRNVMKYTGQIKVERTKKDKTDVFELGKKVLDSGYVLALFPQGTRDRNDEIKKTFTGVSKFHLAHKVPVVPIGIKGSFQMFPPGARIPKFKKIVEVHIGKPMEFKECYDKEPNDQVYRDITNKIMIEIAKLSDKKYVPETEVN